MSKDTSKFSLQKAYSVIQPKLEELSFKPFRHYLGWIPDVIVKIDGTDRNLRYYENVIMAPIGMSINDRVFVINVFEDIKKNELNEVVHMKIDYLILLFSDIGGIHGSWYFQESWFRPTAPGGNYFDCWKSLIRPIPNNDDGFHAMVRPTNNFGLKFWNAISAWSSEAIAKREKRNEKVKNLARDCIEQLEITRRLLAS